jgi:hypothetical protein
MDIQQHFINMTDHEQTNFHADDVIVPGENVLTQRFSGFIKHLETADWERLRSAVLSKRVCTQYPPVGA